MEMMKAASGRNFSTEFEVCIAKIYSLLKPGGYLDFEKQKVFSRGTLAVSDDGDLER
jgi:hypothetical protein